MAPAFTKVGESSIEYLLVHLLVHLKHATKKTTHLQSYIPTIRQPLSPPVYNPAQSDNIQKPASQKDLRVFLCPILSTKICWYPFAFAGTFVGTLQNTMEIPT